jgi:hypothetical protein
MNEQIFRDYLSSRNLDQLEIDQQVETLLTLDALLKHKTPPLNLEDLNTALVQSFVNELIDLGQNTLENFLVMLRYAKATGNQDLFKALFEMLDGCEAMENFSIKLGEYVGEELRDIIFEGLALPPLGLSRREKARYTYRVMRRMEEIFEEGVCREVLGECLRDLPDSLYAQEKADFFNSCDGDVDRFLESRHEKFIERLRHHQESGELFFGQEITDEVVEFVKRNPEIGGGIRKGDVIYETRIPFNTKAYLEETDPESKRYHYCHCPWVRESLRSPALSISATFCQCSAGFHKRTYEEIYGQKLQAEVLQSILMGDLKCRFAIHLPVSNAD